MTSVLVSVILKSLVVQISSSTQQLASVSAEKMLVQMVTLWMIAFVEIVLSFGKRMLMAIVPIVSVTV